MTTLAEIREQYPQYGDMSDSALADALHSKFYSDLPRDQFNAKIGFSPKGVVEDVARQGVGGVNKGLIGALTMPYEGVRHLLDPEGGLSLYIPGTNIGGSAKLGPLGVKLPPAEDMPLYKPFLKQPPAETEAGKYAGSAGEAIGASVVPAGAIMQKAKQIDLAAPAAKTLADKFLRPVAENPTLMTGIDVAASTGSGLAKQGAEEAGLGPAGQTTAAIAGGFATPLALAGTVRGGKAAYDALPKIMASADGAMPPNVARERAFQMVADQLLRAGVSPDEVERRLAKVDWARTFHTEGKAPDTMTLADVDESLARLVASAVRQHPEAANVARPFLQARQTGLEQEQPLHRGAGIPTKQALDKDADPAGMHDRMVLTLKRALRLVDTDYHGHAANANRTDDQIIESSKELSKPAYEAVRAAGKDVDLSPAIAPVFRTWAERIAQEPQPVGAAIQRAMRLFFTRDGQMVTNIDRVDKAKQFLDGQISKLFESVEGRNRYLGGLLNEMKHDILTAVDKVETNGVGELYKKARGIFSSHAESRKHLQLGRDLFSEEADIGIDAFNALPDKEAQKLARLGYLGAFEKKSANLPTGTDRTRLLDSPRQQQILANIIERTETPTGKVKIEGGKPAEFSDRPQRYGENIADEKRQIRTRDIVSGNSKTAEREADDLAFDTLHKFSEVFKDPRLLSIGKKAFEFAINKTFGMRAETSAELARMLLTADEAARTQILQTLRARFGLTRFQRFSELMSEYQRQAVSGTAGGVGSSLGAEQR